MLTALTTLQQGTTLGKKRLVLSINGILVFIREIANLIYL